MVERKREMTFEVEKSVCPQSKGKKRGRESRNYRTRKFPPKDPGKNQRRIDSTSSLSNERGKRKQKAGAKPGCSEREKRGEKKKKKTGTPRTSGGESESLVKLGKTPSWVGAKTGWDFVSEIEEKGWKWV